MSDSHEESRRVHLVLPGMQAWFRFAGLDYSPSLATLMKCATRRPLEHDYFGAVFDLMGYPGVTEHQAPVAALRQTGAPAGYCLCADPVYLQADRDQLLMFNSHETAIEITEARQICHDLSAHFAEDGLCFSALSESQWQLSLSSAPAPETLALHRVVNRPVTEMSSSSREEIKWKSILNEIQMFLYQHPVNDQRHAKGMRSINGVCLWGGGTIPAATDRPESCFGAIYSNEPWLCKLGEINARKVLPLSDFPRALAHDKSFDAETLYVDSRLSGEYRSLRKEEFSQWLEEVEIIFHSLGSRLKNSELDSVTLYPGDRYCYQVESSAMSGIWRRLSALLSRRGPGK